MTGSVYDQKPLTSPSSSTMARALARCGERATLTLSEMSRSSASRSRREHSLSGRAEGLDTAEFTRDRADRLKRHAEQMNLLARKAKERAEEAASLHQIFVEVIRKQAAKQKKLALVGSPA